MCLSCVLPREALIELVVGRGLRLRIDGVQSAVLHLPQRQTARWHKTRRWPSQIGGESPYGAQVLALSLVGKLAHAHVFEHLWQRMLDDGRVTSIGQIAKKEGVDDRYVARFLNLTTLAPEIVAAIPPG